MRRDAEGPAVRFERRYAAPPEQLWAAWTEPERIARWLGAEVVGGPIAPGGSFRLVWGAQESESVQCVVERLRAPEVLEWRWTIPGEAPAVLRVELVPVDGGTVLVLDHRRLPPGQVAGQIAGWHGFLDALAVEDSAGWDERFAALLPAYRQRVAALDPR